MSTLKRKRKPKIDWVNDIIELLFASVVITVAAVFITTFISHLK